MEIILLESFDKLGKIGDTVKVKDGFARNYLLPQKKALRANHENKKYFESIKADLEKKNKKLIDEASKLLKDLDNREIIFIRQASETGQLYGSVSPKDVSSYFKGINIDLKPSNINLTEAIKKIGLFEIIIKPHAEISIKIKLNVATSEESAIKQREEQISLKQEKNKIAEVDTNKTNLIKADKDVKEESDKEVNKENDIEEANLKLESKSEKKISKDTDIV